MNRTDDLTDRLIDGTLTDAEAAELAALVAADPAARARHVAALDLEAALRGLRTDLDLGPATVARIEADRAERAVSAVMAGIAARPAPRSRRRLVALAAALAVTVLVGAWLLRPAPVADEQPVPAEFARLTGVSGVVEVVGPDGMVAPAADTPLRPGHVVRTVGEESAAFVEFPDRTRVELHPESEVRLDGGDTRRVFLVHGQITTVVAGAPTVVATAAADVVATRGHFDLWTAGPGSARVELRAGDARLVRGGEAQELGAGRALFVRDAATPVRVEAAYRVEAEPRARLDFPALDAAFTPDGAAVWAASAKQWARWPVGGAAVREAFPPPVFNDGPAARFTHDLRALVTCRVDDREHRLVVRELPGGAVRGVIPVRVTEPRFLSVAADGSWAATTDGSTNARVRVWDAATGVERATREMRGRVFCTAASPGGLLAVEVSDLGRGTNNRVEFLDPATGATAFELPTRRRQVTALAFGPDGRVMAAGFNGAVQLWDVPGRALVRTIEGFERVVSRVALSPDGRLVAAGTQDGQVWVYEATTGRRAQVLQTGTRGVRALAFSPDGRLLVTATNKAGVAVWDVAAVPPAVELGL